MVTANSPRALTGMHDLLPPESARWAALVEAFADRFRRAGFDQVATPILEDLAVFERVGPGTDIVGKEMYSFVDRDGSTIALRPESTAGVARAFIAARPTVPWRVWYRSEHFRHEKPQKGRLRQHHQLGAEVFGVADPDLDVEIIATLCDVYRAIGLTRLRVEVNDIGTAEQRAQYVERLRGYARERLGRIDPEDESKVEGNALRLLDSKRPATQEAMADAPPLAGDTGPAAAERLAQVCRGLVSAGVEPVVNPRLVRGLDYYNGTVFEVVSEALDAAQSTIGAGGRYDGLVEALGGPPTPGFGFGAGIERILLACDAEGALPTPGGSPDAFVVTFGPDDDRMPVAQLLLDLQRAGLRVERSYDGRSPKAQMKAADRSGAAFAVIVGEDERAARAAVIRPLRTDGDQQVVPVHRLAEELLQLTRRTET